MTDISGYYVGHLQEIIEQQRAEIARLTAANEVWRKGCDRDAAKIERLTAELEYWKDLVPKQVRQNFPYKALEPKP